MPTQLGPTVHIGRTTDIRMLCMHAKRTRQIGGTQHREAVVFSNSHTSASFQNWDERLRRSSKENPTMNSPLRVRDTVISGELGQPTIANIASRTAWSRPLKAACSRWLVYIGGIHVGFSFPLTRKGVSWCLINISNKSRRTAGKIVYLYIWEGRWEGV
jgi:hypothetical protein